jgi:hypothetical protein
VVRQPVTGLGHEPPLDAWAVLAPLVLPGACTGLSPDEDVSLVVVSLVDELLAVVEDACEAPRSSTRAPVPTAATPANVMATARTRERLDRICGGASGRQSGGGTGGWYGLSLGIAPPRCPVVKELLRVSRERPRWSLFDCHERSESGRGSASCSPRAEDCSTS